MRIQKPAPGDAFGSTIALVAEDEEERKARRSLPGGVGEFLGGYASWCHGCGAGCWGFGREGVRVEPDDLDTDVERWFRRVRRVGAGSCGSGRRRRMAVLGGWKSVGRVMGVDVVGDC